jgi:hypothetical protein
MEIDLRCAAGLHNVTPGKDHGIYAKETTDK